MSRFRWSCVVYGAVVAGACSFEAAQARDKDPKQPQPQAGGQPAGNVAPGRGVGVNPGQEPALGGQKQITPTQPRDTGKSPGTPLQQFQPNKNSNPNSTNNNIQGGQPAGGRGLPGNVGGNPGGGGAGNGPAFNSQGTVGPQGTTGRTQGNLNPGTGAPSGPAFNGGQKFDSGRPLGSVGKGNIGVPSGGQGVNSGKLFNPSTGTLGGVAPHGNNSVGRPKINVEPGAGKQTTVLDGAQLQLQGTVKRNPQSAPTGRVGGLAVDPSDPSRNSVKLNPQPGQPRLGSPDTLKLGQHEKTKPLVVSKNGRTGLDLPKGGASPEGGKLGLPLNADKLKDAHTDDQFHNLLQAKKHGDLSRELKKLKDSPDSQAHPELKHLNLDKISGVHQERLAKLDNFQNWQQSNVGQKLGLKQQFELQRQGDLSRRMNLSGNLLNAGGWAQHRQHGVIAAAFTTSAFSVWYAGGGCYPSHSWCPVWSPWVSWCCWDTCPIFYDPRPYFCIPIVYAPCVPWVYYDYPIWYPLPLVSCGTWIDVSPVIVTAGQDLQLLAVRFVDNGHPEQNLGPRYRAWVRNNSPVQVVNPFSVLLLASNEQTPTIELPQMGVVVPSMDIGETIALDIRLPLAANRLGTTPEGYRVPFTYLHVLVDSHQQIPETFENNNGAVLLRTDILPVDPAAFSTDLTAAAPESLLTIAGEGFGPEPGQVIVSVYGQQVQAEIQGWYDLGIRFAVPNFELTQPVDAEILVVRGDSAVSNPLTVRLAPKTLLEEAVVFPQSPTPDPPQ